jgi:hypothetical protein
MKLLNGIKLFNSIPPGVIKDNAAFVSNVIDRQSLIDTDARGVLFVVQLGATDVAMAVLKVMESSEKTNDTTLGGTPAAVHDVATKPSATDDEGIFAIYVPMSAWSERYLQLQATAGDGTAGTYMSALALLDLPGTSGPTAALLNASGLEIAS